MLHLIIWIRYGFDVLIVYCLDRLARDPYIRQTLELEFNAKDVKLSMFSADYEELTRQVKFVKIIDATFAKWEILFVQRGLIEENAERQQVVCLLLESHHMVTLETLRL